MIPGNHDVSLDPSWWQANLDEDNDREEPEKARALFDDASSSGVHLLSEGVTAFSFGEGRSISIYASPYTPEFNGYAFAYGPKEDRFNPGRDAEPAAAIPENVDIVMTYGPPGLPDAGYRLDTTATGTHCGCPKLWTAIQRVRPRLHCFGHIHEGYGVQNVRWNGSDFDLSGQVPRGPDGALVLGRGKRDTVLLNAAIMNHGQDHNNEPWVVDM